jgi:MSHA biogenesis protein MshI
MFKKWFSENTNKEIGLYLNDKQIIICQVQTGYPMLLVKKTLSSEKEWQQSFAKLVDEHQLQGGQVSVVLGREYYQSLNIEKPKVSESELLATLPFTIKDLISESVFDLVVDYYDMPFQQRKGEQITAICVPKTRILAIRDMVLKSGLELKSITIEELALSALLGLHDEANMLLSQQNNELVLTVVKEGQLYFSHRLRGFNELLALPLAEAENALLDGLSLELQRALDYISSQLRINGIGTLYLAVVCPDIQLLSEKLGDYLARNVKPYCVGDTEKASLDCLSMIAYGGLLGEHK